MDSLTQIVLGAAVAEATLGKKVGNKALLWGGIAGTIPDLDVIYIKLIGGGAIEEIVLHRGISHSITFAILMAPLLGSIANRRRPVSGNGPAFSSGPFLPIHFLIVSLHTVRSFFSHSQIIASALHLCLWLICFTPFRSCLA